ncbi:MAG: riboflavin synthase [Bdellovibrionales bacterium]
MFTGLVKDIGTVVDVVKSGDWTLRIKTDKLPIFNTPVGASMACAGICLTIVSKSYNVFDAQISPETMKKTTVMKWVPGTLVNLEPAMRLGDEFGGHMVSGHIDGIAFVTNKERIGDSLNLQFEAPHDLVRFLAPKGSATLDGVSLTINEVDHALFTINIIPHTQNATTLGKLSIGDGVNFEVDLLARYIERLLQPQC